MGGDDECIVVNCLKDYGVTGKLHVLNFNGIILLVTGRHSVLKDWSYFPLTVSWVLFLTCRHATRCDRILG